MLNNDGDYWYGNDGNVGIRMVSRFIQTVTTFWSLRAEWLVNQVITIHIFNECVELTVLVSIFFIFVYIPWMFVNPIYSVFVGVNSTLNRSVFEQRTQVMRWLTSLTTSNINVLERCCYEILWSGSKYYEKQHVQHWD